MRKLQMNRFATANRLVLGLGLRADALESERSPRCTDYLTLPPSVGRPVRVAMCRQRRERARLGVPKKQRREAPAICRSVRMKSARGCNTVLTVTK